MRKLARRFFAKLRRLLLRGQVPAVELALLLALTTIIAATIFQSVGPRLRSQFAKVAAVLRHRTE